MRKIFCIRPFVILAFAAAGVCLVPSSPGALLDSQSANADGARRILAEYYRELGMPPGEAQARVTALSDAEVLFLASSLDRLAVGAGEDEDSSRPWRVALTIFVVLAAITGIYLFVNN